MKIFDFNEKLWKHLTNKLIAVSGDCNFQAFHFPFNNEECFETKIQNTGKRISIFCPFGKAEENLNLWAYSGLVNVDAKELFKNAPTRIEVPTNKMRTKYQSVFSMDNLGTFKFTLALKGGMVSHREYTFDYVLSGIGRALFSQYCERPLSDEEKDMEMMIRRTRIPAEEKEEKLEDLRRSRLLKFLSGVDAIEIIRTTKEFPHTFSDGGAEVVWTKFGYPMVVPNENENIVYDMKPETIYETYGVVMYKFKDKATREAVERRKNIITRNIKREQEAIFEK